MALGVTREVSLCRLFDWHMLLIAPTTDNPLDDNGDDILRDGAIFVHIISFQIL